MIRRNTIASDKWFCISFIVFLVSLRVLIVAICTFLSDCHVSSLRESPWVFMCCFHSLTCYPSLAKSWTLFKNHLRSYLCLWAFLSVAPIPIRCATILRVTVSLCVSHSTLCKAWIMVLAIIHASWFTCSPWWKPHEMWLILSAYRMILISDLHVSQ